MKFVDTGLDGPDESLENWLQPLLRGAELLAAQSGFFSLAGWNLIAAEIQLLLERGGQAHLVVGGRPEQSDPKGLQAALDLFRRYPETTSLVAVNDITAMHTAKAYYIQAATGGTHCWVGSANLTGRGMKVNYQAGIQLGPEDDPEQAHRVLESVTAWRAGERPAIAVDERYIRELWPIARGGVFNTPPRPPRPIRDTMEHALDVLEAIDTEGQQPDAVPTGLRDFDELMGGGLHGGELIIVGGSSGMGKTTLLLNMVLAAARTQRPAGYLTLQTTVTEINFKLLAAHNRVPLHHIRNGRMTDNDWAGMARGMGAVADLPVFLGSHATLTLDQLLLQIEDLATGGAQLVAIDMATQITVPGLESREHELTTVSGQLKAIALQLDIAIVAAWSLGRGPDQRSDKRPAIQDLWGTSQCARDADIVALLHREEVYEYEPIRRGEIDIMVVKNRNGPTVDLFAAFEGHYARIRDLPFQD